MRAAPAATRAPERTKIFVMWPSTWGMIAAEPRDFSVATYSLLSSTETERATSILTGMPGGPWGCAPPAWQAPRVARQRARPATEGGKGLRLMGREPRP